MKYFDHIEDYLQNKLSQEDKLAFDNALKTDEELRNAVEEVSLALMLGEAAFEEEVKGMVTDELYPKTEPKIKKKMSYNSKLGIYVILVAALLYFMLNSYMKAVNGVDEQNTIQFADLYVEPAWPNYRGGEKELIESYVTKYKSNSDISYIDSLKSRIEAPNAAYWISEIYLFESKPDSVLKYLPKSNADIIKRDRLNYLLISSFYLKKEFKKINDLLKDLPKDTDEWYLEKYRLMYN